MEQQILGKCDEKQRKCELIDPESALKDESSAEEDKNRFKQKSERR
jgi:hypothetical protein